MSVVSFAVVGKNNEPLYLKEFFDPNHHDGNNSYLDEELFGLMSPTTDYEEDTQHTKTHHDSSPLGIPANQIVSSSSSSTYQTSSSSLTPYGSCCSIRQQFYLHAALDRLDQMIGPQPLPGGGGTWRSPGVTGNDAMFIGLLDTIEDLRIYGTFEKRK
jgi:hypothetical protein